MKEEKQHKWPSTEYWSINPHNRLLCICEKKHLSVVQKKREEKYHIFISLCRHTSFCSALLYFADNCMCLCFVFLLQRFLAALCWASMQAPFFPAAFACFVSMSHFGNFHNILGISIIIFVMVICDQWSLMLLL